MRSYKAPALKRAKAKYRKSVKGQYANAQHYERYKTTYVANARRRALRIKYGITEEDYDLLFKLQKGRCAICKELPKKWRLCVDHCHHSGSVRGLLCFSCNRAIVALERDEKWVTSAVQYLQKTK